MVRDEILVGNPPKHSNIIKFGLHCQSLLDRWSESLELHLEPIDDHDDEIEPKLEPKPQLESDPDEKPESKHEDMRMTLSLS